jgi:hypothetical protein
MNSFASDTSVPVANSRAEIENRLSRLGADRTAVVTERLRVVIFFRLKGAEFRFTLPMPTDEDPRVKFSPSSKLRPAAQREPIRQQLVRSLWRSLNLTIKAMEVGIEAGIFTFAEIFSPYMVWGDGRTTWEALLPVAEEALKNGRPLPDLGKAGVLMLEAGRA